MPLLLRAVQASRRLPPSVLKVRIGRAAGQAIGMCRLPSLVAIADESGVYVLDVRSRTEAGKIWNGTHDQDDVDFLRAITPIDGTFVDVGANVGLILIPMLSHLKQGGEVIGIEPVDINFGRLERAVALNASSCAVRLVKSALGRSSGELRLHKEGPRGSSGNAVPTRSQGSDSTVVPLRTLDSLVDELQLGRLDTIKIDVEGFELEVFAGGQASLQRFRPIVYGEFNNQLMPTNGASFLDIWEIFRPFGYRAFGFTARMHLVEHSSPSPNLGNAVLAPSERIPEMLAAGVRVDSSDGPAV